MACLLWFFVDASLLNMSALGGPHLTHVTIEAGLTTDNHYV
jgi:hypothetical protein